MCALNRYVITILLLSLLGCELFACTPHSYQSFEVVSNPWFVSENDRYVVVIRRFPGIEDFTGVQYGNIVFEEEEERSTTIAALYEIAGNERSLIQEIPLGEIVPGDFIVRNDGRYIVGLPGDMCGYGLHRESSIAIHERSGDSRLLALSEILTSGDLIWVESRTASPEWVFTANDTLALSLGQDVAATAEIDLASGVRLDGYRPLLPSPFRVEWVTAPDTGQTDEESAITHLSGEEMKERTRQGPMPEYSAIAAKARIRGMAIAEVRIDEQGFIRKIEMVKPLPFGISDAVTRALETWTFDVLVVNGKPVPYGGRLAFRFDTFPLNATR